MARTHHTLRAINIVDGHGFSGFFDDGFDVEYFAHHSSFARMAFSEHARRRFNHLSRLHPQIRAFFRIFRARLFRRARLFQFIDRFFKKILDDLRLSDGRRDRFDRRIQPKFQHRTNRLSLRRSARLRGRSDDDPADLALQK